MPLHRANAYLAIPPGFRPYLGGLKWSDAHDCLVDAAGNTFALAEELTEVLDGVFSVEPVPPFAYVLVALHRMKRGLDDLAVAYGKARSDPTRARHAGLLIADLCRDMPIAVNPPSWDDVRFALEPRHRAAFQAVKVTIAEPTISPTILDGLLDLALTQHTPDTLAAWLKYGAAPAKAAAAKLAQPVEALPLRVGKVLALAAARPRLVGAAWLTPALDAALTFPARRPLPAARRQGGYADVTNRGQPERLLLSQFALDADEFVRRFAERELLYFRPEEPHVPRPPNRVLALDQGVRTWGAVRLALAGCAMALLAKDAKRAGRVELVTSATGPVDLDAISPTDLADVLEASDLTDTPADAIRTALARPAAEPRDVIVLTHPRSAFDPRVITALKDCPPADRVFTVAVDEAGRADIHEWGVRGPVAVRSFRVDLGAAAATRVQPSPTPLSSPLTAWTGEVEPIAFPFRPGLVAEPHVLGFDGASEWLVAASADGALQALTLDGEPPEVLPRPFRDGVVMKTVEAVLGVADGVAVCGRMTLTNHSLATLTTVKTDTVVGHQPVVISAATDLEPTRADWFVAAHYDRVRRQVTLHPVAPAGGKVRWCVGTNRDTVGLRPVPMKATDLAIDVHLVTHQRTERLRTNAWSCRSEAPPYPLPIRTRWSADEGLRCTPDLLLDDNGFEVRLVEPAWPKHVPMEEGKPLFGGSMTEHAQLAGDVLALVAFRNGDRQTFVFRGPDARLVYRLPRMDVGPRQALSPDGRLLAFRAGGGGLSVAETTASALPRSVATRGRLHNGLIVHLRGRPWPILLQVGEHVHTFRVEGGRWKHAYERGCLDKPHNTTATAVEYDPTRFPLKLQVKNGEWAAVVDRLGQVVLLRGGSVIAALLVRRDKAAAYGRGGILWGDPALLGGAPTPHADRDFATLFSEAGP